MDWELIFWIVAFIASLVGFGIYAYHQPDRMSDEWLERHRDDWDD